MTTLSEHLARLILELRATSEAVAYHRQGCAVSQSLARDLHDLAAELDDYSIALQQDDDTAARH